MSGCLLTPWTVALKVPLLVGFPRQEYWSGLSSPPPGYLSDPGMEYTAPASAGRFFTVEPPQYETKSFFKKGLTLTVIKHLDSMYPGYNTMRIAFYFYDHPLQTQQIPV